MSSSEEESLYHRIFSLCFFAQHTTDYVLQNRHQFSEDFVQALLEWHRIAIALLREQRDSFKHNGLLTADFELEMGDVNYDMLKNALCQFDFSIVQPNHVSSFLDIVCQDFEKNLKEEDKFLVAFTMRKILIVAIVCIKKAKEH